MARKVNRVRPPLGDRPLRYLFLCRGNTCRSPIAEILAKDKLGPAVQTRSRAIALDLELVATVQEYAEAWGEADRHEVLRGLLYPVQEAEQAAKEELGPAAYVQLAAHVAASCTLEDLKWADRVFVMSHTQQAALRKYCASECLNIPDPYGGSVARYRKMIRRLVRKLGEVL